MDTKLPYLVFSTPSQSIKLLSTNFHLSHNNASKYISGCLKVSLDSWLASEIVDNLVGKVKVSYKGKDLYLSDVYVITITKVEFDFSDSESNVIVHFKTE